MLIHSASQLITLAGGPQRGNDLGKLSIIPHGAVLLREAEIVAVGTTERLLEAYPDEKELDAGDQVVMPGLCRPAHARHLGGRPGGGVRDAPGGQDVHGDPGRGRGDFIDRAGHAQRLAGPRWSTRPARACGSMFHHGTTTAEVKTGYGLRTAAELRMLQAMLALDNEGPLELAFTFLGAHAVPPEYKDRPDDYTDLICCTMLPMLQDWWPHHAPEPANALRGCVLRGRAHSTWRNRGAFWRQRRELGFPLKIHADEFDNLGGASLAAELGAVSADHLVKTSPRQISRRWAKSETVAVALPCTPFGLAESGIHPGEGDPGGWWATGHRHRPEPRARPGAATCSSPLPWPAAT